MFGSAGFRSRKRLARLQAALLATAFVFVMGPGAAVAYACPHSADSSDRDHGHGKAPPAAASETRVPEAPLPCAADIAGDDTSRRTRARARSSLLNT